MKPVLLEQNIPAHKHVDNDQKINSQYYVYL